MELKAIEIFSGIGGMSKGLIDAGIDLIAAVESNTNANSIYKMNFKNVNLFEKDIYNMDLNMLPNFDLLCSGFPVQPFSLAGNNENRDNITLSSKLLEIINLKQPRVFLFETIPAFKTTDKGKYYQKFTEMLVELGYSISAQKLNDSRHGGLPHNRDRLFIVGFRNREDSKRFTYPDSVSLIEKLDSIIEFNQKDSSSSYINEHQTFNSKFDRIGIYRLKFNNQSRQYIPYNENVEMKYQLAPPLLGGIGLINRYIIRDTFGIRRFRADECANLLGLNDLVIDQKLSIFEILRLLGNASSPILIKRLASRIVMALENRTSEYLKESLTEKLPSIKSAHKNDVESSIEAPSCTPKSEFATLLYNIKNSTGSNEKGKVLEVLVEQMFSSVDGFSVRKNVRTKNEEIDLIVTNESTSEFWKKDEQYIIVECKNWSTKCDRKEYNILQSKIENRNHRVKSAYLISWNGFTEGFDSEMLRNSKETALVIPVTGEQIVEAITSNEIESYLKLWYEKAVMK